MCNYDTVLTCNQPEVSGTEMRFESARKKNDNIRHKIGYKLPKRGKLVSFQ